MNFALVYLLHAALRSVVDFLSHWYVDGSRAFYGRYLETLHHVEKVLAPGVTLRHLFQPLYRDYSIVGRIIGPIFRLARAFVGFFVVAVVSICYGAVYVIWIVAPVLIIVYATGLRR